MDVPFEVARALSSLAFVGYGVACIATGHMVEEFERFGLPRFRVLVGWLEVLGALGLVAGIWWPPILVVSSGGLTVLMLLGVATRLRIRDSLVQTAPAAIFLVLNGFIFAKSLHLL